MKIRIGICDDSDHDRHYLKSIIKRNIMKTMNL